MSRESDPIVVLKKYVDFCGSQRLAADRLGYSRQYISQLLNGHRPIQDDMLKQLGLRRTVVAMEK